MKCKHCLCYNESKCCTKGCNFKNTSCLTHQSVWNTYSFCGRHAVNIQQKVYVIQMEYRGGGHSDIHMYDAWTRVLKYTPKCNYVMMQKSPLNKDFVGSCLKFDTLIGLSLNNLSKSWQNHPLFPEKWHFRPRNAFPALRILLQKRPFSCLFCSRMCIPTYLSEWPPRE